MVIYSNLMEEITNPIGMLINIEMERIQMHHPCGAKNTILCFEKKHVKKFTFSNNFFLFFFKCNTKQNPFFAILIKIMHLA
jgi:hypothetical protein